jgi:hypothetical protein
MPHNGPFLFNAFPGLVAVLVKDRLRCPALADVTIEQLRIHGDFLMFFRLQARSPAAKDLQTQWYTGANS